MCPESPLPASCPDCEPKGEFVFEGNTYPAYIALCERCTAIGDAYDRGYREGYDRAKGQGSHRRDFPDLYEGMICT
jgi:hypothetical protein